MFAALKTRDYRLLWSGQGISHLGDQFHLVALPWLVLTLTHDPLQLGIVLALAGVPRAALMLLGGAFADRHSPRTIMLVSDALRFVLVGAVAVAVLTGTVQLWMIYLLALAFGIVSGFFMPAAEAALPRLVEKDQLEGGNALMMGVSQFAGFVGPALAGTLIALFGASHTGASGTASLTGIGIALAIDSATFVVSAVTLMLMCSLPALGGGADKHPLAAVAEGVRFAASRPAFRWLFGMIAAANLLLSGALTVGIPVLAQTRFPQGAAAYGFILSAYAVGNLAGYIGAGSAPRPAAHVFTLAVVGLFVMFGAVVGAMAFITSTWLAVALMAVLGIGNGYIAVIVISSLQRMTPEAMLGRVMGLLVLAMVGLVPVSQAVAGLVIRFGAAALFVPAGAALAAVGIFAAVRYRSWSLDMFEPPPVEPASEPA